MDVYKEYREIIYEFRRSRRRGTKVQDGRPINSKTTIMDTRAEVRRSFITTTVREESQVIPQGRHRDQQGSNWRPT